MPVIQLISTPHNAHMRRRVSEASENGIWCQKIEEKKDTFFILLTIYSLGQRIYIQVVKEVHSRYSPIIHRSVKFYW
jgi:hypothetical protein